MNSHKIKEYGSALGMTLSDPNTDGWMMACCPFAGKTHSSGTDRNPSFGIHVDDAGFSGYHCFSCKQKGLFRDLPDALAWAREIDPHTYSALSQNIMMEEIFLTPVPFDEMHKPEEEVVPLPPEIYDGLYDSAWSDPYAREYLLDRGISKETAELLDLLFDPDQNRILFQILDEDRNLYGYTGRLTFEHDVYPKIRNYAGVRKEKFLLGEQLYQAGRPVIVVEGLFAYAHLYQIGAHNHYNIVATMGSEMSDDQASLLISWGEETYILYDNDLAGEQGLFGKYDDNKGLYRGGGAIDKLSNEVDTYVVPWIDGKEDPDELSGSELMYMINNAELQNGLTTGHI